MLFLLLSDGQRTADSPLSLYTFLISPNYIHIYLYIYYKYKILFSLLCLWIHSWRQASSAHKWIVPVGQSAPMGNVRLLAPAVVSNSAPRVKKHHYRHQLLYRVSTNPWLWLCSLRKNCCTFLTLEVAEALQRKALFSHRSPVSGRTGYCVVYRAWREAAKKKEGRALEDGEYGDKSRNKRLVNQGNLRTKEKKPSRF